MSSLAGKTQEKLKGLLKEWLPPGLIRRLRRPRGLLWVGDFATWKEAQQAATGYDSPMILDRVKDALLKVKRGEAAYERDAVLFEEIQYSWPLLAGLLWIAAQKQGRLNVLDFGGSLGSTYFQNRLFLQKLPSLRWNIVEQEHFVAAGQEYFADETLRFYYDIASCWREASPETIILSSVVQFLEDPYGFLEKVLDYAFEFIIFDRTPFHAEDRERLTIQQVPEEIYQASYPCWLFQKRKFYDLLTQRYELVAVFPAIDGEQYPAIFEGCILSRK
jgi:putative methyltransferase (TIGR04325 family)